MPGSQNVEVDEIVDFKTDLTKTTQPQYRRQVEWYVYGLSRLLNAEAEGWLLGV